MKWEKFTDTYKKSQTLKKKNVNILVFCGLRDAAARFVIFLLKLSWN